jgi:hypothetical protein
MPRIRSERPAFDARFPHLAVDTSHVARNKLAAEGLSKDDARDD